MHPAVMKKLTNNGENQIREQVRDSIEDEEVEGADFRPEETTASALRHGV